MHASSLENMKRCFATYFASSPIAKRSTVTVLDIGGADVNGSYADLFREEKFDYKGVDLEPGDGVSIVLEDPYMLPLADESVDLVVSGQMLEHCEFFWLTFTEMMRVLKKDGLLFLIAPSGGPIHRYPVDCYRFYPDAFHSLAKYAKCHAIDVWHDNRGPWNDLVGVFSKTPCEAKSRPNIDAASLAREMLFSATKQPEEFERTAGDKPYLDTLAFLHQAFIPKNYLEIGVREGNSLALAKCPAVGVDPLPAVSAELGTDTRILETASDDFFADNEDPILEGEIDFAFIDGMHWFEYALRDFMNIERLAGPGTVVIMDDVFPNHPMQAIRERETVYWTGDVWKFYDILLQHRPDLTVVPLDTAPTGLLLICGLDPNNDVLWQNYNPIIARNIGRHPPPQKILNRIGAVSPKSMAFKKIVQIIKVARERGVPLQQKHAQLHGALSERDELNVKKTARSKKTVELEPVDHSFKTGFTADQLESYQRGVMGYRYKGIPCLKSPIDLAIYLKLLTEVAPSTIFEIGSKHGGSAALLRDMAGMVGGDAKVVSIDINRPKLDAPAGIEFVTGDALRLDEVFLAQNLYSRPRPWLIIEDSAHSFEATAAAMEFCSSIMERGEYLVVEDGVLDDLGLSERYNGGPNRAIREFMAKHPGTFRVDRSYCDMFGVNMTYNPNGYLVKL